MKSLAEILLSVIVISVFSFGSILNAATPIQAIDNRAATTKYNFTEIDVPDATCTSAFKINASKQIVGGYCVDVVFTHGFLLDQDVFTTIDVPGARETQALGLNDSGQIVGYYIDNLENLHGFMLHQGVFTLSMVQEVWDS